MRNGTIIETTTLEDILSTVRAGNAASTYNIGDAFSIDMNAFTLKRSYNTDTYNIAAHTIYATIIGIDHNSTREGTNKIHLQLGQLANGTKVCYAFNDMNATNTNVGGWESSKMRTDSGHLPAILAAMPQAWQDAIVAIPKWSNNSGSTNNISDFTETNDKLFLLSEYEVFGSGSYSKNTHESQFQAKYDYYTQSSDRIRYAYDTNDRTGTSVGNWWLRSPGPTVSHFCSVKNSLANYHNASYNNGVAPGFTIG